MADANLGKQSVQTVEYMSVAVNPCDCVTAGLSLIGQKLVHGKARLKATHQVRQLQRQVSH